MATPRWKHDVFLSFRGNDTRWGFLSHLHEALQNTGVIRTFKDDNELRVGEYISPSLLKAIQESMLAVVVLSENYASSPWCLDELNQILKCMEGRDTILPVFYQVDPADVRHQLKSFEVAFADHRNSGRSERKLEQWKLNLRKVANLSGWHSKNYENESVLVKRIVEVVCRRVKRTSNSALSWKHDVFLSFSDEETGIKGLVSKLYHEMENRGIKSFRDDRQSNAWLDVDPNLLMEISESRLAIIILSPVYASSTWCLEELTIILRFMYGKRKVIPLFANMDPSDVHSQIGSFKESLARHEELYLEEKNTEKVKQWRAALTQVTNLSVWCYNYDENESELVKCIVDEIRPISTLSVIDFEEFQATRQASEQVMKALKDDEVRIIGVYGMAGVGKTTLVKYIAAQAVKIGMFDYAVMVVVSKRPDWIKIQSKLADLLGLRFVKETVDERASELEWWIKRGARRTLIILDDVWEGTDLFRIGLLRDFNFGGYQSKVLLSTRILNVCYSMEAEANIITLNTLSEEDSWKFFMKKLGRSIHESTSFYDVGMKLAKDCGGLPNALKAAARLLGDKDLDEWNKGALRETAFHTDVFESIKSSYCCLRDEANLCFFLCCLFPEDDDIQITDLVKYVLVLGCFQQYTFEQARYQAYSVVEGVTGLTATGLLLCGRKKGTVRMHNVIRNVAISTSLLENEDGHGLLVKAGCGLEEWSMDACKEYSAISLMGNKVHKLPRMLVSSKLQILLLQNIAGICEIPETFFPDPNALRVIDLSATSISLLPQSFNLLTNLRALYLDNCKTITKASISLIAKLNSLQILNMREFPVKEFPEELGKLIELRMLDITGAHCEIIPAQVISRLYNLEELYIQCNFRDWGSKVDGQVSETIAGFEELTGLRRLDILKVCISDAKCLANDVKFIPKWVKFDICINQDRSDRASNLEHDFPHHHHSRALTLDTSICTLPDWFINMVTERAEALRYLECKGLTNILEEYERGRLVKLKYLTVVGRHENLKS